MVGGFACPECGQELALEGVSPGRHVQCEGCSTWVEVPFLPRVPGRRRGRPPRRRPAWESKALRASVAFAAVALLGLAGVRAIGGRVRSGHERVLVELLASADEAEAAGRHGAALREIEAALARSRQVDREGSGRLAELLERRDRASLREARARLGAVDALGPDQAVGESLTMAERARVDPALAPLAGAIEAKLAGARLRQAEADLGAARRAFDEGRPAEAFAVADRLHGRADRLDEPDARRLRDAAGALIEAVVARDGVAIGPVAGRFVAGSIDAYAAPLERTWAEALRLRGYLPPPRQSPWRSLWDEKAPARASTRIVETQEEFYLQSKNRTTQVEGTFELARPGRPPWTNRVVARTRVPLPHLPAYLAGHLATADRRDPEVERRLHDDAQGLFEELALRAVRAVPPRDGAPR